MHIFSGFMLVHEQPLPELNSAARFCRHAKTGAELLSLVNEDDNKVFGVTFRTPPRDFDWRRPHPRARRTLRFGKYPVKEPFVELMKGSLNTFLNAMTFPDKTCYPVASQNLRDFYNLIDVYLDAFFYPLITPNAFRQEGWHYELDAIDEPLVYKGVVFNEMKGSYSSKFYANPYPLTIPAGHPRGNASGRCAKARTHARQITPCPRERKGTTSPSECERRWRLAQSEPSCCQGTAHGPGGGAGGRGGRGGGGGLGLGLGSSAALGAN